MITDNFKNGKEMDHSNTEDDQMKYQQRGYAKYADLARVYGWHAWEDFHKTENRVAEGVEAAAGANLVGNPNRPWEGTDSRTLRLSIAAGEVGKGWAKQTQMPPLVVGVFLDSVGSSTRVCPKGVRRTCR